MSMLSAAKPKLAKTKKTASRKMMLVLRGAVFQGLGWCAESGIASPRRRGEAGADVEMVSLGLYSGVGERPVGEGTDPRLCRESDGAPGQGSRYPTLTTETKTSSGWAPRAGVSGLSVRLAGDFEDDAATVAAVDGGAVVVAPAVGGTVERRLAQIEKERSLRILAVG